MARPDTVTVIGLEPDQGPGPDVLPVRLPIFDVAVHEVIFAPLLEPAGSLKETVAEVDETVVAVPIVGAAGVAVDVVIELDAADEILPPTEFVQFTVNVYIVPGVKPVTVIGLAPPPAFVATTPPGLDVAVQVVIDCPLVFP